MLEKSLSYVRSMSYNLAPPDVIRNDIAANVMNLAQNFKELSDTEIRFTMPEKLDTSFLTEEENLNLYRIIQESLMNIRKHAQATEVTVLLRNANGDEAEGLYIFISDDGKGFDVSESDRSRGTDGKHLGLVGMKERADFIGAKLEIDSHPNEGTQISIIKLKDVKNSQQLVR
jgi:signal transduction histidine kinase